MSRREGLVAKKQTCESQAEELPLDWPWVIPLTRGYAAIVDEEDYGNLVQFKWSVATGGGKQYARRDEWVKANEKPRSILHLMHRVILDAPKGFHVDHINRNGLDNRRCNLRVATRSQNKANSCSSGGSSKFKGVDRARNKNVWQVRVMHNGVHYHLGSYRNEEDAALAYDRKAVELFGEFARLNLPGGDDGRVLVRARRGETYVGEKNHNAKLTQSQALEIKKRALAGEKHSDIACDFGVTKACVGMIKTGSSWGEVLRQVDDSVDQLDSSVDDLPKADRGESGFGSSDGR